MGKATSVLAIVVICMAAIFSPRLTRGASAQTVVPAGCNGQPASTPMQGRYTGAWQSNGDYHFYVFGTDLNLKITIDGTLELAVSPQGQITGTASGSVDAPIYDYGRHDISSGIGSISGPVSGVITAGGSLLLLAHPVIDMHWGTFGGHAIERLISMPDYSLSVGGMDCVSTQGTIAETGFPDQNIVADGAGQMTHAPGVGTASGNWSIKSDESEIFNTLSQRVESFISVANSVLANPNPTPTQVKQDVGRPLRQLEDDIRRQPDIARCLFDRLAAWQRTAIPSLWRRAHDLAATGRIISLRQAGDIWRAANVLNLDCSLSDGGTGSAIVTAENNLLDRAVASHSWSDAAALGSELLLVQGDPGREAFQQRLAADIHAALQGTFDAGTLLDIGRVAYAAGDDSDATAVAQRLTARVVTTARSARDSFAGTPWVQQPNKHRKKKKQKPAPKPTPTPVSRTVEQVLAGGLTRMVVNAPHGTRPEFAWQPVSGATRYVLLAQQGTVAWTWSGSATAVAYGDTSREGLTGSGADGWSVTLSANRFTWSVLALNDRGQIVAARLRAASQVP